MHRRPRRGLGGNLRGREGAVVDGDVVNKAFHISIVGAELAYV